MAATAGTALIEAGEYLHTQEMPSPIWHIEHNLSGTVQIQCYDESGYLIYPEEINIYSINKAILRFGDNSVSGYAIVKRIGHGISEFNVSYFKVGTGGGPTWNTVVSDDIETEVYRNTCTLQSDDGYYFVSGVVSDNKGYWKFNSETGESTIEASDINITEIGVFNADSNIVFYTHCSLVYRPIGVDLRIWMRAKK